MDNGPELIAHVGRIWVREDETIEECIPLGRPWLNGLVEFLP